MQGMEYLNSAVNNNRQMYQTMSNSGVANNKTQFAQYSASNIQVNNDEVNINQQSKKRKKHNTLMKLITGASVLGVAAVTAVSVIKGKNSELIHAIKTLAKNGDLKAEGFSEQTIKKANSIFTNYNSAINFCINFGTIRDDFADCIVDKTKGTPFEFIRKGADRLRDLYNKWTHDGAFKAFAIAKENLPTAKLGSEAKKVTRYEDFFKDANEYTQQALTKGKRIVQELRTKPDGSKRNVKEIFQHLKNSGLADDKLTELYDKYLIKINQCDNLTEDEIRAVNKYNKSIREAIERLRDTNIGNPISDAAGVLVSAGGLGAAIATAEDKKEQKSIVINLGIPILTTIATVIYGSTKSIAGVKSMILGAGLGFLGSALAKSVDMATKEKPSKNLELKA